MEHTTDIETLWLVLSIAGAILLLSLGIIGFFTRAWMKMIHEDVKYNTAEHGKNKGRIDLVSQQQKQDKAHLEEMTQLQIQGLTNEVKLLSGHVSTMTTAIQELVVGLAGEGIKIKK